MKKENEQFKEFLVEELNQNAEEVLHAIEADDSVREINPPKNLLNRLLQKLSLLVALLAALSMGVDGICMEDISEGTESRINARTVYWKY